jgi:hypothetical protein
MGLNSAFKGLKESTNLHSFFPYFLTDVGESR